MVYAGSIERIDFGEEREDKGFVWVQVEKGHATYDFIPCQRGASSPSASMPVPATCFSSTGAVHQEVADAVVRVVITVPEHADVVDDRLLRQRLQEAYLIAGITKEVEEGIVRTRDASLTETLGPLQALERYLLSHPEYADRQQALLERAQRLLRELQEELGMIPLRLRLHNFMSYGETCRPSTSPRSPRRA